MQTIEFADGKNGFDAARFQAAYEAYSAVQPVLTMTPDGSFHVTSAVEAVIPEGLNLAAEWLGFLVAQGYVRPGPDGSYVSGDRRPPFYSFEIDRGAVQTLVISFTVLGGILVILGAILAALGLFVVPAAAPASAVLMVIGFVLMVLGVGILLIAKELAQNCGPNGVRIEFVGDVREMVRVVPR